MDWETSRKMLKMIEEKPGIRGQEIMNTLGISQEELASATAAFMLAGQIQLTP